MKLRRKRSQGFSLFFATDIHGSERCFRKWLNAGRFYGATVIVLGGDIAGKAVAPIVEDDGTWVAELPGERFEATTEEQLTELQERIRRRGMYDVVLTVDELAELRSDDSAVERLLETAMTESLRRWVTLAEERLAESDLMGFAMLGNDDPPGLAEILGHGERVVYCGEGVVELPLGLELVSCGYSTPTPWNSPRELPEEELAEHLESLIDQAADPRRAIFNIHCPPRETRLDQAPVLDDQLDNRRAPPGCRWDRSARAQSAS